MPTSSQSRYHAAPVKEDTSMYRECHQEPLLVRREQAPPGAPEGTSQSPTYLHSNSVLAYLYEVISTVLYTVEGFTLFITG